MARRKKRTIGRYERALFRLIKKWGGRVESFETSDEYKEFAELKFSGAPFTSHDVGVNFRTKTLYYSEEEPPDWTDIVHEMGHIFATKHGPTSSRCLEPQWIGWEYALVKRIRAPIDVWYESVGDYSDDWDCDCCNTRGYRYIELGDLSPKCLREYFKDRVAYCVKRKTVEQKNGRYNPIPVR
jgi:hypothetical protein